MNLHVSIVVLVLSLALASGQETANETQPEPAAPVETPSTTAKLPEVETTLEPTPRPTTTQQPQEQPQPTPGDSSESKTKTAHAILKSLTGDTIMRNIKGLLPAAPGGGGDFNATNLDTLVKSGKGAIDMLKNQFFTGLGKQCKNDADCTVQFAECKEGTCWCRQDYMPSSDNATCLRIAKEMGDDCRDSIQCTSGLEGKYGSTMCINLKCSCAIGSRIENGKCIADNTIGTSCAVDADCLHANNSECIQGVCACPPGSVPAPEEDQCIPVAKSVMDDCQEDGQCTARLYNSICQNNKCVCREFNIDVDGKCVPIKALGDNCTVDRECEKPEEERAYMKSKVKRGCVDNKCACVSGKRDKDVCTRGFAGNLAADGWSTLTGLIVAVLLSKIIVT